MTVCLSVWPMWHWLHHLSSFQWCEAQSECNRLKLKDFLAKPMQRLTKYPLLFSRILHKTNVPQQVENLQEIVSCMWQQLYNIWIAGSLTCAELASLSFSQLVYNPNPSSPPPFLPLLPPPPHHRSRWYQSSWTQWTVCCRYRRRQLEWKRSWRGLLATLVWRFPESSRRWEDTLWDSISWFKLCVCLQLVQPYTKLDLLAPMPNVEISRPRFLMLEGRLKFRDQHTKVKGTDFTSHRLRGFQLQSCCLNPQAPRRETYVFLFSDMLIVTKTVKRGDKYTVIKSVSN